MKQKDNYPDDLERYTPAAIHLLVRDLCLEYGAKTESLGNDYDEGPHTEYDYTQSAHPEVFAPSILSEIRYVPPFEVGGELSPEFAHVSFKQDQYGATWSVMLFQNEEGETDSEVRNETSVVPSDRADNNAYETDVVTAEDLIDGVVDGKVVDEVMNKLHFTLEFVGRMKLSPEQAFLLRDQLDEMMRRIQAVDGEPDGFDSYIDDDEKEDG